MKQRLARIDWLLTSAVLFLLGLSTIVLFAIEEGAVNAVNFSPSKHVLHVLLGLALAVFIALRNYRVWHRLGTWLYWTSILLLVLVLFANPTSGSSRWLELGFIQFQPSELAKFALVLLLARLFARRKGKMNRRANILLSLAYAAVPTALILQQPDLGTSIVFILIWATMILVSDIRIKYIAFGVAIALAGVAFSFPQLADYQRQRVMTFLDPSADPLGAGYNVRQAAIAIGSGGVAGQGLDAGTQSQLSFLPAQHTDFIFAVTAEKLGLLGAIAVIAAYAIIIYRIALRGLRTTDSFAAHVAMGFAVMLAFHVVVNIGMNLGLVPVTGLPLPLMSYGGTHMVMMLAAIGIVQSLPVRR